MSEVYRYRAGVKGEQPRNVEIRDAENGPQIRIRGEWIDAQITSKTEGSYKIKVGEREALVFTNGKTIYVKTGAEVAEVELNPRKQEKGTGSDIQTIKENPNGGWEIVAPMPGQTKGIHVEPGAKVDPETHVLDFEAMKMVSVFRAGREGIVEAIFTEVGAQVNQGQPLVRFSPKIVSQGN